MSLTSRQFILMNEYNPEVCFIPAHIICYTFFKSGQVFIVTIDGITLTFCS